MTWHALHYPLRPGSEDAVRRLFQESGRPNFDVRDDQDRPVGRLLGTIAFVGAGKALRAMEVDGPLPLVAAHMSRQPQVRAFEQALEAHLAEPRDMRSPEGARAFFRRAGMPAVLAAVPSYGPRDTWHGACWDIAEGSQDAVGELLAGTFTQDVPTLVFVGPRRVLWAEATGEVRDGAVEELTRRLGAHLAPRSTAEGAAVTSVLVRRHDLPLAAPGGGAA